MQATQRSEVAATASGAFAQNALAYSNNVMTVTITTVTATVPREVKSSGRYWQTNAKANATTAPLRGATYCACGAKGLVSG